MTTGGWLAALLDAGRFVVTSEVVPPRSSDASPITVHARALAGYVDAVNLTDNPAASAHMSPLAGVRAVANAGIEPTVQLTSRDRNRLAITADLLGAWALGARNVLCLSGDPLTVGDHPDALAVADLGVNDMVALARRMRDEGTLLSGAELTEPPRYLVGVADVPLADDYDPARIEAGRRGGRDLDADRITTSSLAAWADRVRPLGVLERAKVLVGIAPLPLRGLRPEPPGSPAGVRVPSPAPAGPGGSDAPRTSASSSRSAWSRASGGSQASRAST
ncbi:MAG: methylenetetrahydrofolate reductase [Actinomycetota bacterium]